MRPLLLALPLVAAIAMSASVSSAQGVELGAATPAQKIAAGADYKRGLLLFNEQKYDAALEAFRASYAQVKSPNPHLMIGRTLSELNRLREAHAEFQTTLAEGENALKADRKYQATVEETHAEIDALLQKVARLDLAVNATGGRVSVDGVELTAEERAQPVIVDPGTRHVVLVDANGERVERDVAAEAGKLIHVELAPPAKPPPPAPAPAIVAEQGARATKRKLAYVFGGVGVASMATFAVFAAESSAKYSDLQAACTGQSCPASKRALAESGKHDQTAANAALFVGLFALGTGAVLLWQSADRNGAGTGVGVRAGAGSVTLDGRF